MVAHQLEEMALQTDVIGCGILVSRQGIVARIVPALKHDHRDTVLSI
jgi:hypothetical protein